MSAYDDVAYSEFGLSGRDIFFSEFSDVLFYFEDADHEVLYEKFVYLIAPEYLTSSIICLGGKSNVLTAANSRNDVGCPRIFVVDKDFDDILGVKRKAEGLIYLEKYCLENYLLNFRALIDVVVDRFQLSIGGVNRDCKDFDRFFEAALNRYIHLTRLFLVARKFKIDIKTTKMHHAELHDEGGIEGILSQEFVDSFLTRLLEQALLKPETEWIAQDGILNSLMENAFHPLKEDEKETTFPITHHLCGKHLFGVMKEYISRVLQIDLNSIPTISLYMDVVGRIHGFAGEFSGLKDRIDHSVARQRHALVMK